MLKNSIKDKNLKCSQMLTLKFYIQVTHWWSSSEIFSVLELNYTFQISLQPVSQKREGSFIPQ